MRSLVTRHPLLVVVTTTLAGILSLLWLSGLSIAAQVLLGRATISLLAAGLLVWLGWWREAGFVRPRTWRVAIPYLPILLIILVSVVPPLVTNGVRVTAPGTILVGLLAYLLGGFFEEALFRGVVLRVLLPFGLMRAAIFSALPTFSRSGVLWAPLPRRSDRPRTPGLAG